MGDIYKPRWMFFSYPFTYFLCLKVIRDKLQDPWKFLNGSFTHRFGLRLSGTNSTLSGSSSTAFSHIAWVLRWSGTYSSIRDTFSRAFLHIACFKMIRNVFQPIWVFSNSFFTHFHMTVYHMIY